MFDHIRGNPLIKGYLEKMVCRNRVANSLLFCGPSGIGKSLFAESFAKLLICHDDPCGVHARKIDSGNHPDIRIFRPEGKIGMHSIQTIREFQTQVYQSPFEAKWKVLIVHEADRMLVYSANALLKVFEEPLETSVIILLSSAPSSLLPTVLSRCRTIHFRAIAEEEIASYLIENCKKTKEEAMAIAALSEGSIGQAVRLCNEEETVLRKHILSLLADGKFSGYKQLKTAVAAISEHFDAAKLKIEAEVRVSLEKNGGEQISSVHKQAIEKEIEGAVAMHTLLEVKSLFVAILGWYRDLHLLKVHGDPKVLFHRNYASVLTMRSKLEDLTSLEKAQEHVKEVLDSLERSTSVEIAFENLFLKLDLLSKVCCSS